MTTLQIAPWPDPRVDRVGHTPTDPYIESCWLPVLGPSATWLWLKLARMVEIGPGSVDFELLADSIGVKSHSKRTSLDRVVERLAKFHVVRWQGEVLEVRRVLPSLPAHWVAGLPEPIRRAHAAAVSTTVKAVAS